MIQITDDPSAERTALPHSTHVRSWRRLLLLDPARGKERLMKIQQHDGVVVDAAGIPAGLRQASSGGRGVARGEDGAKCKKCGCPPSLYSPTCPVILQRCQPQHPPVPEPVNPRTPLSVGIRWDGFAGSGWFSSWAPPVGKRCRK